VIEAALQAGVTPVPIRFGQVLPDLDAVRGHLASRDYAADLERVADAVEFGIRVIDPEEWADESSSADAPEAAPGPGAPSGVAYLRAVADRIHAAEDRRSHALEAARGLDRDLAEWVRDSRIEPSQKPPGAVVAHLVQTGAASEYLARARQLSAEDRRLRVVVTGPWPPYSFVG
jgi:hypothetical protein